MRHYKIIFFVILFLLVSNPALALRPVNTPTAKKIMAEAMALLEKRDYTKLENLLNLYLKNEERVEDGQWKFHIAMD